jgi:hypothetical protein
MATVTKDFKVKNGIKVQGDANIDGSLYVGAPNGNANATVNGSDIITEDIITGGTQTNIAVTYNASTKTLDFVAENGIADSTTTDLVEGTNLYFTDARAVTAVEDAATSANTANKIVKRDAFGNFAAGQVDLSAKLYTPEVQIQEAGNIFEDSGLNISSYTGNNINISASQDVNISTGNGDIVLNPDGDVYLGSVNSANVVITRSDIDALTTSDIEEGTNLYFTDQRAIDAVGGSASSENIANTVVKRDSNGSFAAGDITAADITADSYTFTGGSASITNSSLGMAIFASQGDITLGAMTGEVQIGGAQVTTESNTQTLTNKAIGDSLAFSYGTYDPNGTSVPSTISVDQNTDLTISSGNNANIIASGDIVLASAIDGAYIGSTTEANKIATHGYVDNAVAGLAWKESVHLLYDAAIPVLSGSGASQLIIDGHDPLGDADSGYRILITQSSNSGIYVFNSTGGNWTLTRAEDADTVEELIGAAVFVMEGTQYNATSWVQANHYASTFGNLSWTQFSGTGNYTAGFGINLVGREFSADTDEMATSQALTDAVGNLTDYVDGFLNSNDGTVIEYIDEQDASTLLAANGYSDTLVATGDATATPQYLAINVNDVAKQVASTVGAFATLPTVSSSIVCLLRSTFVKPLSSLSTNTLSIAFGLLYPIVSISARVFFVIPM